MVRPVTTAQLENLEKSGNWIVVREKSGKMEQAREKSGKVIITILQLRIRERYYRIFKISRSVIESGHHEQHKLSPNVCYHVEFILHLRHNNNNNNNNNTNICKASIVSIRAESEASVGPWRRNALN